MRDALSAMLLVALAGCAREAATNPKLPGDPYNGREIAEQSCSACHGMTGRAEVAAVPVLAEQYPEYLVKQLKAFAAKPGESNKRINAVMGPIAARLTQKQMDDVSSWYANQFRSQGQAGDPARLSAGEMLFQHGNPAENLPACASCHRPSGSGIRPDFPNLASQDPAYVEHQLEVWEQTRGHPGKLMSLIVPHMKPSERAPLADYIASLKPVPGE